MDIKANYQEILERWTETIASLQLEATLTKFYEYLKDPTEEGVASALGLLTSFGDEGLCAIVLLKEEQIVLREDLGIAHQRLMEKEILDFIDDPECVWFPLYEQNAFSDMEFCSFADTDWMLLTKRQQSLAVQASLKQVRIPAGRFVMGAQEREEPKGNEMPRHLVTLTRSFNMCIYPCTQALFASISEQNPSIFKGATRPANMISWCDAILFCNRLSEKEGLEPCYEIPDGLVEACEQQSLQESVQVDALSKLVKWKRDANGYRLPTEAEWEYAAKAGQNTIYAGSETLTEVGWFDENSQFHTKGVGEKKPNAHGLYDMSGNVHEWVWDFFDRKAYSQGARTDPSIDEPHYHRSYRGGCFFDFAWHVRICYRHSESPSDRVHVRGFRLVRFCVE